MAILHDVIHDIVRGILLYALTFSVNCLTGQCAGNDVSVYLRKKTFLFLTWRNNHYDPNHTFETAKIFHLKLTCEDI